MTDWRPRASGEQLQIGETARAAYAAAADNWRLALDLAWLPFVILALAEVIALLLGGGGTIDEALSALVHGIGFIVLGSVFVVRWYRFLLLGETASAAFLPPGWGGFVLTAIKVGLALLAGYAVLAFLVLLPPHFLTGLLAFLGVIALGFAAARVSLVFPAAAVERPMTLRRGWDLLEGNYWRLIACLLLCSAPFGIADWLIDRIGGDLASPLWFVFEIIGLAVSFAGAAVVSAMMAEVYRDFVPAGAPPAQPAS